MQDIRSLGTVRFGELETRASRLLDISLGKEIISGLVFSRVQNETGNYLDTQKSHDPIGGLLFKE